MKQHTWIAGAVAAMLIAAPSVQAQTGTSPVPLTATDVTNIPVIPMPEAIDYSVLKNQNFTLTELNAAEARGLTENEIASAATISTLTGVPFTDVTGDLERGVTFPFLASKYGIPVAVIYDTDTEKTKIADFKKAAMTTGTYAMKAMKMGGMSGGMMADSSTTSGSMAPSATPTASTAAPAPTTSAATTTASAAPTGDIVDVASANPNLSTLVSAIQAAGLVDTLKGTGPFTVFAPTNRAFARLPRAQRTALLADPTALKNILTYHVIAGQKIDAATAMSMTSPTSPATVQGGTLQVTTTGGRVHINNATVTQADIQATNGVIHVIDRVLVPAGSTDASGTGAAGATGTTGTGMTGTGTTGTGTGATGTTGTAGTAGTGAAGTNGTGTGTTGQ